MEEIKIENDNITKKKSNNLIKIILLFVLLLGGIIGVLLFKNNKEDKNKKEQITPIMYEITKEGSNNKIYLFGSMHMVNHDEFDYPDYVLNAYNNSDYVACEFDVVEYTENSSAMDAMEAFMYKDGSTIRDHMSEETYNKVVKFLTDKYTYNENFDIYNMNFFETLITEVVLSNSKVANGSSVDSYFLKKAKEDNKTILEVESFKFQMDMFKMFPDKLFEIEILEMIDNFDESVKELNDLYEAWKKGDISTLDEESDIDNEKYTEEEIKLLEDYNKKMLDDRNIGMTDKLISYFDNNYKTFYMVGAAHLLGDNGIAHLLEEKGYKVTRITK